MSPDSIGYLPLPVFAGLAAIVVVFGACIGSFLNVVIYRLPIMLQRQWRSDAATYLEQPEEDEKPLFNLAVPRSACPVCSTQIKAWQNIPVISYVLLRGKCHACKAPISIRYPLVEALAGGVTFLLFMLYGLQVEFFAMAVLTYVCIALAGIDIDHHLLPDNLTLPLMWAGLALNTQSLFASLPMAVWGAILGYGILWVVFWLFKLVTGKEGMGYGDFKLMAAFGAWFGWPVLPNTILLSSLLGAIIGGVMIWRSKETLQTPIPYGPFIILAGWLTAVFPHVFTVADYL